MKTNSKALNLWLVNQFEKDQALLTINQKNSFMGARCAPADCKPGTWMYESVKKKVTFSAITPSEPEPKKWANVSIDRNLKKFLEHNDLPDSKNVLNDHSQFDFMPILSEGWVTPIKKFQVNPRRDMPQDNICLYGKFDCILRSVGFDENNPICIDLKGRILDGAYRMYTMASLWEEGFMRKVFVRMYDFE